jgi:ditrans,polycis-polyprenyl diphosphate synthase
MFESYFISCEVLKKYKSLHIGKLRYLAIVIESEEAHQTSKVIKLLQWLDSVGVKNVCLYDMNGMKDLDNQLWETFFYLLSRMIIFFFNSTF